MKRYDPMFQRDPEKRTIGWVWLGLIPAWAVLFSRPFRDLAGLSFQSEIHSHAMLIPLVTLYLIWLDRKTIFGKAHPAPKAGGILLAAGLLIHGAGQLVHHQLTLNDALFFAISGGLISLLGLFIWRFGTRAFRAALFPLLFLGFMIPIPSPLLNGLIRFLQAGSADMTARVFEVAGIPFFRDGTVFELQSITIEVARQCSGIRSTLALIICAVFAGYLFLNSGWRRALLVLAVIPISIFKNALRIGLLAYLGVYVDSGYLTDSLLHSRGGIPFLFLALLLLAPVVWILRRSEKGGETPDTNGLWRRLHPNG